MKGQKGWLGDSEAHAKAGQKGGLKTRENHDREFFVEIGRKGGMVSPGNFKRDPEKARAAGIKGWLVRKSKMALKKGLGD